MKKKLVLLTTTLVLMTTALFAQTELKQYKAGHTFDIGLPEYMGRTIGLNSVSAIEYKNAVKDVYGFVIFDTKEDLALVDMNYSSINEFYEDFIKDFLKDEERRNVSKPLSQKKRKYQFC